MFDAGQLNVRDLRSWRTAHVRDSRGSVPIGGAEELPLHETNMQSLRRGPEKYTTTSREPSGWSEEISHKRQKGDGTQEAQEAQERGLSCASCVPSLLCLLWLISSFYVCRTFRNFCSSANTSLGTSSCRLCPPGKALPLTFEANSFQTASTS
jgi:hypothetical protein